MEKRVQAEILLHHLVQNYRSLQERAGPHPLIAVVKANAYGHDISLVGPELRRVGCELFAVTDAWEGATLRELLGDRERERPAQIFLLSGIVGEEDARLTKEMRLCPVLSNPGPFEVLERGGFDGPCWLKFDSGMHRLGFYDLPSALAAAQARGLRVEGVLSHFACADEPGHPLNARQVAAFARLMESLGEGFLYSLCNSAGIENGLDGGLPAYRGPVRAGISLYGCYNTDQAEAEAAGLRLRPVMRLRAKVLQRKKLRPGDCVSYGATFVAEREMEVAVVAAGYADGVSRAFSNRGRVWAGGKECPILGRVCMDLCIVDVSGLKGQVPEDVVFWGEGIRAEEAARRAGLIPYELFTGVGQRVPRIAVGAGA
ncbi:MAG TPA: alanine racemase [Planctomycetes bacterium]|nr:alanine racemase [Planctomycetota bacterium]